MIRAVFLFLLLIGVSYGALWGITCTPIFKDKARVRAFIKMVALGAAAILIAIVIFASIFVAEHQI